VFIVKDYFLYRKVEIFFSIIPGVYNNQTELYLFVNMIYNKYDYIIIWSTSDEIQMVFVSTVLIAQLADVGITIKYIMKIVNHYNRFHYADKTKRTTCYWLINIPIL